MGGGRKYRKPNSHFNLAQMGRSVRTANFRYTKWFQWDGENLKPSFRTPAIGVELYNHTGDLGDSFDGDYEAYNLANDPRYDALVREMDELLLSLIE